MLSSLLKFFGLLPGNSGIPAVVASAHNHKTGRDDEIPRYPPFMQGLPVIPPDRLLQSQSALIERIRQTAVSSQEVFDRHYYPAIQRYSAYVHLLPASQSHHHRGAGGLLRHSLEVALYALQSSERVLLDIALSPAKRREMEPRWQLAVFLAALCHDAGKPMTDLTIANRDRTVIWKPITENLYDWASRNGILSYYLDWREGRGRQHTALSNLMADRIIGTDTLAWIEEGGIELIIWLMESLNANPASSNSIHDLVIKADQTSVERDLKTIGATLAGFDLGIPVERMLTDIMRRLTREGVWRVNEPGARVWKIAGNTYLVWPAGGEDIARIIREEKLPGLARTPEGILEMLIERKLAYLREDGESPCWQIAPHCLKQKMPDIRLQAIQLKDDVLVSSMPLQPVEGDVYGDSDAAQQAEIPAQGSRQDATFAASDASQPALSQAGESNESNPDLLTETAGRILAGLLESLESGKRQWGRDVLLDDGKHLLIRWPEALSDCGLPLKSILEQLSNQHWLWVDPVTPWKKVIDVEMSGQICKAIKLEPRISQVMVNKFGDLSSRQKESPSDPTKAEAIQQKTASSCASMDRLGDVPPADTPRFPTRDELIIIMRHMDRVQPDQDGWIVLDRKLLARVCRESGYRCTVVSLSKLVKQYPERLAMEGGMIKYKP